VLRHAIVQFFPHSTRQLGPLSQAYVQSSLHRALQSLAKLLHDGAQPAPAHSSAHAPCPPLLQSHAPVPGAQLVAVPEGGGSPTLAEPPLHATTTLTTAPITADLA